MGLNNFANRLLKDIMVSSEIQKKPLRQCVFTFQQNLMFRPTAFSTKKMCWIEVCKIHDAKKIGNVLSEELSKPGRNCKHSDLVKKYIMHPYILSSRTKTRVRAHVFLATTRTDLERIRILTNSQLYNWKWRKEEHQKAVRYSPGLKENIRTFNGIFIQKSQVGEAFAYPTEYFIYSSIHENLGW